MPRDLSIADSHAASVGDCLEAIRARGFDPADEGSLHHAGLWLRRLGNNRHFLGDMLLEGLKARLGRDGEESAYGPQVVMLSPARGGFFLRANIWPSEAETLYRASRPVSFVYGMAHGHNFDFLTVGYFGPGYWSDYWEAEYETIDGWRGEPVDLRFAGRQRLCEGRLLHYRAHRDVHCQHPPDALSVSLNVMHATVQQPWFDQYGFDTAKGEVSAILNPGASETMLRLAVGLGGSEALDLAERFAAAHPSGRMRIAAFDALAGVLSDPAERDAVWRQAEGSGLRVVAMEAKARRAVLASPTDT